MWKELGTLLCVLVSVISDYELSLFVQFFDGRQQKSYNYAVKGVSGGVPEPNLGKGQ